MSSVDVVHRAAGPLQCVRALPHRFVLEQQRHRHGRCQPAKAELLKEESGCLGRTDDGGDDYVGVEHDDHIPAHMTDSAEVNALRVR